VYLPEGRWSHYWSGETFTGPAHILAHAPLGQPAMFLRANTAVPLGPDLTWLVQVDPNAAQATADLYEDDGEGFAFEAGHFSRTRLTCNATEDAVVFAFESAGELRNSQIELDCRGVSRVTRVEVDGTTSSDWDHTDSRLRVRVTSNAKVVRVALR
jgi:alpha-glucosidase